MGRSVSYLSRAQEIAYTHIDTEDEFEFEDLVENLKYELKGKYKSLSICENEWEDNETKIILDSTLVQIGVSEYCGLVSISIRPKDNEHYHLGERWINQNWSNIRSCIGGYCELLNRLGTFSNGEGVFQKAS